MFILSIYHQDKEEEDHVPFVLHPPASTFASSVWNIHCPSRATFEVEGRLRMSLVREPGIMKNLIPSPALNPPCEAKRVKVEINAILLHERKSKEVVNMKVLTESV